MMAQQRSEILIVGGGIGGLSTALALSRAGIPSRVLERSGAFQEVGAGLQLGPNGARALDRLGILTDLFPLAVFPSRISIMDIHSGEPLNHLQLGDAFRERYGYRYMVMHRHDLLTALLGACRADGRITLETGKLVEAVAVVDGRASVTCADGSHYRADLLVGADGLSSTVRKTIVGDGEPDCTGYVAFRGTVPFKSMSAHAGADNVVLYTGHRVHLVQYPLRGGELYNQVAVFQSDQYSGAHDRWGWGDELDRAFLPTTDYVRRSVQRIDRSFRWPLRDRPPTAAWRNGPILLLGDAAHPMLQYLAQGACQALEDSVMLADCLSRRPGDQDGALSAFVDARSLRTARIQITARLFGEIIHAGGIAAKVRDRMIRDRRPDDYSLTDWLYGETEPPHGLEFGDAR